MRQKSIDLPEVQAVRQIVLVVEYDGTRYAGFQLQKNSDTIQGELEKAVERLTGSFARVYGSSRTDSGVHAMGQVVSFRTQSGIAASRIPGGLNHYLPEDIAVTQAFSVLPVFDVRRQAVSREYRYYILNRHSRHPLRKGFYWQLPGLLDIDAMNEAAACLIGVHDFAAFATRTEPQACTTRRLDAALAMRKDDLIIFMVEANAFLPQQVRNMTGLLTRVGRGQVTPAEFKGIMKTCIPGLAQPTAPPDGLVLYRVNYARELKEENLE